MPEPNIQNIGLAGFRSISAIYRYNLVSRSLKVGLPVSGGVAINAIINLI
jgi:hypothetical protein